MTAGIEGTGLYGKQRELAGCLRADRQHLENAPLGVRARRNLEGRIARTSAQLKIVRQQIRDEKKKRTGAV